MAWQRFCIRGPRLLFSRHRFDSHPESVGSLSCRSFALLSRKYGLFPQIFPKLLVMRLLLRPKCPKQSSLLYRLARRDADRRQLTTTQKLPAEVQQVQLPKLVITPGSAHHNSLPSFLEYANRVNLAPSKTYFVGTHYEYITALSLLRLGFSLLRTGRKADAGIDLIGHWILPQFPEPLPVIVQCKARNDTLAPRHVRELEGAFRGTPPDWRKKDVLALLATTKKASRGVLDALGTSRRPMGFLKISRNGTIEQFLWNRAAGDRGLGGVGVTIRHTPRILLPESEIKEQGEEGLGWNAEGKGTRRKKNHQDAGTKKDIQLTWMGSPIFPDRDGLGEETVRLMNQIAVDEEDEVVKKPRKRTSVTAKLGEKKKTIKRATTKKATMKKTLSKTTTTKAAGGVLKRGRGRPPGAKNKKTIIVE